MCICGWVWVCVAATIPYVCSACISTCVLVHAASLVYSCMLRQRRTHALRPHMRLRIEPLSGPLPSCTQAHIRLHAPTKLTPHVHAPAAWKPHGPPPWRRTLRRAWRPLHSLPRRGSSDACSTRAQCAAAEMAFLWGAQGAWVCRGWAQAVRA